MKVSWQLRMARPPQTDQRMHDAFTLAVAHTQELSESLSQDAAAVVEDFLLLSNAEHTEERQTVAEDLTHLGSDEIGALTRSLERSHATGDGPERCSATGDGPEAVCSAGLEAVCSAETDIIDMFLSSTMLAPRLSTCSPSQGD